jgi:hypothetical protein
MNYNILKKVSNEFLRELCLEVKGNTDLEIGIMHIARKLSLEARFEEFPPEILADSVNLLHKQDYVEFSTNKDKVKATWVGINFIINLPNEIPENYGAVSFSDMQIICKRIIEIIEESMKTRNSLSVLIAELEQEITSFGSGPINQALDFLWSKNIVEIFEKDKGMYVALRSPQEHS